MKPKIIILVLLILVMLSAVPVQAQTITMANPGGIAERDMIVYNTDGTMQGYYNSTSVITLNGSLDYIFTMKPVSSNVLDDPGDFLSSSFDYVQTNVIPIVIIIALFGFLLSRR